MSLDKARGAGVGTLRDPRPGLSWRVETLLLIALLPWLVGCGTSAAVRRPLPMPNVDRGVQLYRAHEFERASQVLEVATRETPRDARGWTYLGLSQIELNVPAAARSSLLKAIELNDSDPEAHYGLGLAYGYLGDRPDAIRELKRAVALNPKHSYAHYHLGLALYEAGNKDQALLHLERFLELAPHAPEAGRVRTLLQNLR